MSKKTNTKEAPAKKSGKTNEKEKQTEAIAVLSPFELPSRLIKDEDSAIDETYAKFIAEPFEGGFGHTVGNSLRRVLLSSIEGAAITKTRISGAQHEFATIPGVVEDLTSIVLNLKQVLFKHEGKETRTLHIDVEKQGEVTAGDIQEDELYKVINKDQVICTLDSHTRFEAEIEVQVGRGFRVSEENKSEDMPIGIIPMDSLFSPVKRARYLVENTRVGHRTDYDKLILEIWTDGRINPADALLHSSAILRKHLDIFVNYDDDAVEFDSVPEHQSEENAELRRLLNMSVNEIELSVRAANCLNSANIATVGMLAMKSEAEMLKYRNFGKKSLNEIKDKLNEMGLSLGMQFDPDLLESPPEDEGKLEDKQEKEESGDMGLAELISQNL